MGGVLVGRIYARSPRSLPLVRLAFVAGAVVCACSLGVALTPENRLRSLHVVFTKTAFRTFPAVPLFLALAARRNAQLPSRVTLAWATMIVLLVAYVIVLEWGPRISTTTGLVGQVTAQKVVAIGAVLLLVYQSYQAEVAAPAVTAEVAPAAVG